MFFWFCFSLGNAVVVTGGNRSASSTTQISLIQRGLGSSRSISFVELSTQVPYLPSFFQNKKTHRLWRWASAPYREGTRTCILVSEMWSTCFDLFFLGPCAFADVHSFNFPRAFDFWHSVGSPENSALGMHGIERTTYLQSFARAPDITLRYVSSDETSTIPDVESFSYPLVFASLIVWAVPRAKLYQVVKFL